MTTNSDIIQEEISRFHLIHPLFYDLYTLIKSEGGSNDCGSSNGSIVVDPSPTTSIEAIPSSSTGKGGNSIQKSNVHSQPQFLHRTHKDKEEIELLKVVIREHLLQIEDAFVNSPEWTLPRSVRDIRLGVIGSINSGKAQLVHRFMTGKCLDDSSPILGGRFKKRVHINNEAYLLLIRDDISPPSPQFINWFDGLMIVANSGASTNIAASFFNSIQSVRTNFPVCLVALTPTAYINDFRALRHDLFHTANPITGKGVDRTFEEFLGLIIRQKTGNGIIPPTHQQVSLPSTPTSTPTSVRKASRRRSNIFSTPSKYKANSGRSIPAKQGTLLKKTEKKWKKKYVVLSNDKDELIYYSSLSDYMEDGSGKTICLSKMSIKSTGTRRSKSNHGEPSKTLSDALSSLSIHKPKVTLIHYSENKTNGQASDDQGSQYHYGFVLTSMENKVWEFETNDEVERDSWVEEIEKRIVTSFQCNIPTKLNIVDSEIVNSLANIPGNDVCADCSAPNPLWASLNFGILICKGCSGIHRNLGSHLSRVRSLDLDEWSIPWIRVMQKIGNQTLNSVYEHNLKSFQKPTPTSKLEIKTNFIKAKYVDKRFLRPFTGFGQPYLHKNIKNSENFLLGLAHLKPSDLDTILLDGRTCLVTAIIMNDLAAVQLLLWNNATIPRDIPSNPSSEIKDLLFG